MHAVREMTFAAYTMKVAPMFPDFKDGYPPSTPTTPFRSERSYGRRKTSACSSRQTKLGIRWT